MGGARPIPGEFQPVVPAVGVIRGPLRHLAMIIAPGMGSFHRHKRPPLSAPEIK